MIVVCDRGMATRANLEAIAETEGVGWITALKAPAVQRLVKDGELQLSLFDQQNLAEISSDAYPGERLIVCRNPLVGEERARKRVELLAATETELEAIAERVRAGTLRGCGGDRPRRRPGAQALQGQKALRGEDHRRQSQLLPQAGPDRR